MFPAPKSMFYLKRYFDNEQTHMRNPNWDKVVRTSHDPATRKFVKRGRYEFDFFLEQSMSEIDIDFYLPNISLWSGHYNSGVQIKMVLDDNKISMISTNYDGYYTRSNHVISAKVFNVPAGKHNIYLALRNKRAEAFYPFHYLHTAFMIPLRKRIRQYVEMVGFPFDGAEVSKRLTPFDKFNQSELPAGGMIAVNPSRQYFKKVIFNKTDFHRSTAMYRHNVGPYNNYDLQENPNFSYDLKLKDPLARLNIRYHLPFTGVDWRTHNGFS